MAATLAALALWLIFPGGDAGERRHGGTARRLVDRSGRVYEYRAPLRRGVLYSSGVGFVSSFLGIGGGHPVLLLVRALGFPVHIATATGHFVLAIMAGGATITHAFAGSFGTARPAPGDRTSDRGGDRRSTRRPALPRVQARVIEWLFAVRWPSCLCACCFWRCDLPAWRGGGQLAEGAGLAPAFRGGA